MAEPIAFTVPGEPRGKGRARAFRRGNFVGHYTPEATASYENLVKVKAMEAMAGRAPLEGALHLEIACFFAIPASWSKKRRAEAMGAPVPCVKKPDADNIIKAICDGCNAVVYADDKQVATGRFGKFYGPTACVSVIVRPIAAAAPLLASAA